MVEDKTKEVEAAELLPNLCKNSKCCGRYTLFA